MFGSHNDNQQSNTDIDEVAKDIDEGAPSLGIGTNPSSFTPVMPAQAQGTPPVDDDDLTTEDSTPTTASTTNNIPADLSGIRDQALQQLSPLVSKLDQNPEDKFKTLMMMIQASDNHDLIKEAYEAANSIPDETAKAQALLAIVNEINYFTQKHSS